MQPWYKSKKIWGTILACFTLALGADRGWDPEVTLNISRSFMAGVFAEGIIDAVSAYRRKD